MQLRPFVEGLQADLEGIAAVGDDAVAEAAAAPPSGDEVLVARISLRLPETLKAALEAAAAREGVSVNTWLVRTLSPVVSSAGGGGRRGPGNRLTGFGRSEGGGDVLP